MMRIGRLPEDLVRKEIDKVISLVKAWKFFVETEPENEIQEVCRPVQKQAIYDEIRSRLGYLKENGVNIKAILNEDIEREIGSVDTTLI